MYALLLCVIEATLHFTIHCAECSLSNRYACCAQMGSMVPYSIFSDYKVGNDDML